MIQQDLTGMNSSEYLCGGDDDLSDTLNMQYHILCSNFDEMI